MIMRTQRIGINLAVLLVLLSALGKLALMAAAADRRLIRAAVARPWLIVMLQSADVCNTPAFGMLYVALKHGCWGLRTAQEACFLPRDLIRDGASCVV
jgi:hypothetical protein